MKVAIIGAGNWGTALAIIAARNSGNVHLWSYDPKVAEAIRANRENPYYLRGVRLPAAVQPTSVLAEALEGATVVVLALPSHVVRSVVGQIAPHLMPEVLVISATKGIENDTLLRMSEVVAAVLPGELPYRFAVLSGPTFAAEVARGEPAAAVVASDRLEDAEAAQKVLSTATFRLYTNPDLSGVEVAGAVKNVIALAAGMVTGLGYGYNTTTAVVTRGVAEIARLVMALGGRSETMLGLAGVGDLMLTCFGALSRNRQVGIELGKGRTIEEITADMREVAEGVRTARAVYALAGQHGLIMPITTMVYQVLYEAKTAAMAATELMERPLRGE